ncbi:hypothetical protein N657DRAFT_638889 [Parathielavia appendiculata]|uniref:Uncharacterized protein n=1 Tax=Parathielavia appendiculata TaxID=2587402 RepID=A0AAN6U8H4_9PEZI|nr:hypothetical protein N657DRAFT_638889 [Parathielavia appendiculata]
MRHRRYPLPLFPSAVADGNLNTTIAIPGEEIVVSPRPAIILLATITITTQPLPAIQLLNHANQELNDMHTMSHQTLIPLPLLFRSALIITIDIIPIPDLNISLCYNIVKKRQRKERQGFVECSNI